MEHISTKNRKLYIYTTAFSLIVALIYVYDFFFMVGEHGVSGSDVKTQIGYVEFWMSEGHLPDMCQAYPLYYVIIRVLFMILHRWTPVILIFTFVWSFAANAVQILIMDRWTGSKGSFFPVLTGSALSFIWPISFQYSFFGGTTFWEMPLESVFLTSGTTSPNHSLTFLCVKPFALIVVWLFTRILYPEDETGKTWHNSDHFLLAIMLFLSALAKPNFYQVFAPAGTLFTIIYFFRKGKGSFLKCLKIAAAFVPATVWVLYSMKYKLRTYALSPLEGISLFGDGTPLFIVLTRAVVFCIFVTILGIYFKTGREYLLMGWLTYVIGTGLFLLLIEPEDVLTLSMSWGYFTGQYILFAMSVVVFGLILDRLKGTAARKPVFIAGTTLLCLHTLLGIAVFITTWWPWWRDYLA